MALQFQDLPIPLTRGQNGSENQPLIPFPEWASVQNGEFDDRGRIKVVEGTTVQPLSVMTGETAVTDTNRDVRRLAAHQDELLLETWAGIYRQQLNGSFALAAASSNGKRELMRCARGSVTSIADAQATKGQDWTGPTQPNPSAGISGMDSAVLGDYVCLVWAEIRNTSGGTPLYQTCWQIRHKVSDALVGRGALLDNTLNVREPRVLSFNSLFHVYVMVGGNVGYISISPTATQNVATGTTLLTAGGDVNCFDVTTGGTQVCLSLCRATALQVVHATFAQATPTTPVASQTVGVASAALNISNAYFTTSIGGGGASFVAFYVLDADQTRLRWSGISAAGALVPAATTAAFTTNVGRTCVFKSFGGAESIWPVLVETFTPALPAAQDFNTAAVRYDATTGASGTVVSVGDPTVVVREHFIFSQPICPDGTLTSYTGTQSQGLLLGCVYSSDQQNVFQVFDIARSLTRVLSGASEQAAAWSAMRVFDAGNASPLLALSNQTTGGIGRIGHAVPVPGETLALHFWCAKFTPNITNATDLGQNPTNIQRNTIRYTDTLSSVEFAGLTYLPGGTPLVYDGQDVFEEGFAYAPEIVSVTPSGAGGPLSAGSYGLVLVYEWYDGQGNRWQSQVSRPVTFTAAAANTYTAVVRSLRATLKSGVNIVPYRTAAAGTIYRRDSPLGTTPLTDAAIASSEALYLGGGQVLRIGSESNNALPAVRSFVVHQKRLFAVGGENERGFFYSKEVAPRFPGEWNRSSGFGLLPDEMGRVTVAQTLDDKIVFCGEKSLAVMFGDGPNGLWQQNSFSAPIVISSAEGIRYDTPFAISVEDGFWYVTSGGPRLLTRGLSVGKSQDGRELGDRARSADQSVIGKCEAILSHPTKKQVHFLSSSQGRWYIYDTKYDQWTFRATSNVRAAVATRDTLWTLSNALVASNPLGYVDPNSNTANPIILTSGWVSFAGVQRFQRWTNLQVLGESGPLGRTSNFDVTLQLYTGYDDAVAVQNSIVTGVTLAATNAPWQVEFQIQRQTDQAYKMVLTVLPTDEGGDFSLTSLLARVGLKRGGGKLPAAQRG